MASDKTERNELARLGATPVKNSGRGQHDKGDGIIYQSDNEPWITVDVKEYAKGYRLTPENWTKINTDAKANRTDPALMIVLGENEPKTRIVAISEHLFKELMEVHWMYRELG